MPIEYNVNDCSHLPNYNDFPNRIQKPPLIRGLNGILLRKKKTVI